METAVTEMSSSESASPAPQEKIIDDEKDSMTVGRQSGPSLPDNDSWTLQGKEESVESSDKEGQSHEESASVGDVSEIPCQLRRSNRDIHVSCVNACAMHKFFHLDLTLIDDSFLWNNTDMSPPPSFVFRYFW
jgi:hypothetical protein